MPNALIAGIEYKEFFHYTPFAINKIIEAYNKKNQEKYEFNEYISWLNGMYVSYAISSCFSKSGAYPDKPVTQDKETATDEETGQQIELTEEEKKKKQVEGVFMFLQVQQANKKLAEKFGENKEDINGSEV